MYKLIEQFYNFILTSLNVLEFGKYKVDKRTFAQIQTIIEYKCINTVFVRKLCKPRGQANTSVTEHKHTVFVRKLCNNKPSQNYNRTHFTRNTEKQ